jgi:hypothetical protein
LLIDGRVFTRFLLIDLTWVHGPDLMPADAAIKMRQKENGISAKLTTYPLNRQSSPEIPIQDPF